MSSATHAKTALDILERFRQCQNTLGAFTANLSALENITLQKLTLEGAIRRNRLTSRDYNNITNDMCSGGSASDDNKSGVTVSNQSHVMPLASSSPRVATAPLGVLAAFPPSLSAGLMLGQHQADQGRLLAACAAVAQSWQQRTQAVATLVDSLDGDGSNSDPIVTNSTASGGGGRPPQMSNQQARKALLKQAAESLYGGTTTSSSVPSSSSYYAQSSSNQQQQCSMPSPPPLAASSLVQAQDHALMAATGLPSLASLRHAAHGLLAALTKMGSLLQECVLALRVDLLRTSCDGGCSAGCIRAFLARETKATSSHNNTTNSNSNSINAVSSGMNHGVGIRTVAAETEPLDFLDALTELQALMDSVWERRCKARYLDSEALILLAS